MPFKTQWYVLDSTGDMVAFGALILCSEISFSKGKRCRLDNNSYNQEVILKKLIRMFFWRICASLEFMNATEKLKKMLKQILKNGSQQFS